MNPSLFKKHTIKVFMWISISILIITGIYFACLLTVISELKIKIALSTLGAVDLILMIFILAVQSTSRLFIRLNFNIEYQKNDENIIKDTKIIISNFSWVFSLILVIAFFFIQLGGLSIALNESFLNIIQEYWWIAVILLTINSSSLIAYYFNSKKLLTKDVDLKKDIIKQYDFKKNDTNN